jgi:hypothetical protein
MTDTNTDRTYIYVFLATILIVGAISVGFSMYFSLRCMRARGEALPEAGPLHEVVVISPPSVGVLADLLGATQPQHQPQVRLQLLAAQQLQPA